MEISKQPSDARNLIHVTCQVNNFYPLRLLLSWLENGNIFRIEEPSTFTVNKDGTYNWTSWVLVNTSANEEDLVLTCQVEHDGMVPVLKSHTVVVHAQQKGQGIGTVSGESPLQLLGCLYILSFWGMP